MNPENQPFIISHAQNREDIILSGFFEGVESGFYVDVGANDPAIDSVTKNFYEKGWRGINIEPIKNLYERLEESRPRDINLNIGISDKPGELTFREYKEYHGLSTFSKGILDDYDKFAKENEKYRDYIEHKVEVKTLKQILEEQDIDSINFLKVDVEGYEYEVLRGNDWDTYRPQVICIESNHTIKDYRPILVKHNYEFVLFDGLNDYYTAKEASKVRKSFSYVQTMLPTPIVDYRVMGIIEYYKKERLKADSQNVVLNNELYTLKHMLYQAQTELNELTRLKGLLKAFGRKINVIIEGIILPNNYRNESVQTLTKSKEITISNQNDPTSILYSIKQYDSQNLTKLNPSKHRARYFVLRIYRRIIVKGLKAAIYFIYKILRKFIYLIRR